MDNRGKAAGPLAGVRVVDLTAMVMGPYATQIMADMGAEVIKVEPPAGDNTRYISVGPARGMSGVFVNINRGKKSVVLDLREDAGKAALSKLVETADVFIHSMRGKAIAKLGFAYADVRKINPRIVYTNCYGYSRRGPDRDRTAYDDTIQAECGLNACQEMLTGEASFVGTIVADKVAGLTALYATLAALFHRERTGEGQEVEVAMFETMAAFMLVEHANGALFQPPLGPAIYPRPVAPNRKPYPTKDGHIAALIYNDKQWNAFVEAVNPAWAAAPEFATLELRQKQIDKVYGLLGETFRERTTAEWLELLQSHEIPAAAINTPADLFDDPHLNAVGLFETVETKHGPVRFPGPPPGRPAKPPPDQPNRRRGRRWISRSRRTSRASATRSSSTARSSRTSTGWNTTGQASSPTTFTSRWRTRAG
jgi:crotonobetainyl-CoA:carnitine CoA-transferase CaiB-like acyl-CoA transferase